MENIQITKDCIQSINNIGSTTYQNICNGTSHVVKWGSGDWLCNIALGGLITLLIGVVVAIVVFFIKEINDNN